MSSAQPTREIRRATAEDFHEVRKLWWRAQLDAEELEPHIADFQIVVEKHRIIGALGLRAVSRQGKVYGEAFDEPELADELRPLLWERVQIWAKNLGLWRLWTPLTAQFWIDNGFRAADAGANIPQELNIDQSALLVLQLAPEPSRAAAALGEMGMMEVASRARRIKFPTQTRVLALCIVVGVLVTKLFIASVIFHDSPRPALTPKANGPEHKVNTNNPPAHQQRDDSPTIKA